MGRRIYSLSGEGDQSILQVAPARPRFDLVFCMPRYDTEDMLSDNSTVLKCYSHLSLKLPYSKRTFFTSWSCYNDISLWKTCHKLCFVSFTFWNDQIACWCHEILLLKSFHLSNCWYKLCQVAAVVFCFTFIESVILHTYTLFSFNRKVHSQDKQEREMSILFCNFSNTLKPVIRVLRHAFPLVPQSVLMRSLYNNFSSRSRRNILGFYYLP